MRHFVWKTMMPLAMLLALQGCKKDEAGNCDDGKDNDKNGQTDCDDAACDGDAACLVPEVCDDGIDNDEDGSFDCADVDCAEECLGNNGFNCAADVGGVSECNGTGGTCVDESGGGFPAGYCISECDSANGNADCAATGGVCTATNQGDLCLGGCDVANGGADCRDGYACTDFAGDGTIFICFPACDDDAQCVENGANGAPNSCDVDPASQNVGFCIPTVLPEVCNNTIDDDLDGDLDCADDDCAADPICIEDCDDGIDNDVDGQTDCSDGDDCAADAGCIALIAAECAAAPAANEGANTGDTTNGSNLFAGSCTGGGQEDVFVFTPTVIGDVELVLVSVSDLGVYARTTCADTATELDCADVAFPGSPFGNEDTETLLLSLADTNPVSVFVDAFTGADNGPYTLTITPVVCGDGLVSGAEECDDQDLDPGDGCDAACVEEVGFLCQGEPSVCTDLNLVCADDSINIPDITVATAGDNTAGSDLFNGSCTGGGLEQLFTLVPGTAGQTGELTVILSGATDQGVYIRTTCADDTTELDCEDVDVDNDTCEDGTTACTDATAAVDCAGIGAGLCAQEFLTVPVADAGNALTIFVDAFLPASQDEGPFTLVATFVPDVCGDGLVTGGESCDDGDLDPADGCDAVCAVEPGFVCAEEPSVCTDLNAVCNAATAAVLGANAGNTTGGSELFIGPPGADAFADCPFTDVIGGGPEELFSFTPAADGNLTLTLVSATDHGVYVRTTCIDDTTVVGCADAAFPGNQNGSVDTETTTFAVTGGVPLTIFVDAFLAAEIGPFTLTLAVQ